MDKGHLNLVCAMSVIAILSLIMMAMIFVGSDLYVVVEYTQALIAADMLLFFLCWDYRQSTVTLIICQAIYRYIRRKIQNRNSIPVNHYYTTSVAATTFVWTIKDNCVVYSNKPIWTE